MPTRSSCMSCMEMWFFLNLTTHSYSSHENIIKTRIIFHRMTHNPTLEARMFASAGCRLGYAPSSLKHLHPALLEPAAAFLLLLLLLLIAAQPFCLSHPLSCNHEQDHRHCYFRLQPMGTGLGLCFLSFSDWSRTKKYFLQAIGKRSIKPAEPGCAAVR